MSDRDNWEFYQDRESRWRWRRRDPRHRLISASRQSYRDYLDCVNNARRNGFSDYIRIRA